MIVSKTLFIKLLLLGFIGLSGFLFIEKLENRVPTYTSSNIHTSYKELSRADFYEDIPNDLEDEIKDSLEGIRLELSSGEWIPGDTEFFIATLYYQVLQSYVDAFRWYRKSAEKGNPAAQFKLGHMLETGEGVLQNEREALKWYRMSAKNGNSDAQFEMGHRYYFAHGVPKNDSLSIRYFKLSADQLNIDGILELAYSYLHGEGVPQDYDEAAKYYWIAAHRSSPYLINEIGDIYYLGDSVPQDYKEAMKYYLLSAEEGDSYARFYLGWMYHMGQGVSKSLLEAKRWYCLSEHPDALVQLKVIAYQWGLHIEDMCKNDIRNKFA